MLFNKNKTKENMTMDEENKMVELTDEQLKQVSGGTFVNCTEDCGGRWVALCWNPHCEYNRKPDRF